MSTIPWLMITIFILIVAIFIAFLFLNKNKKSPPDYYSFFIMGITWLVIGIPLGVSSKNYGLFAMGVVFTIVGLVNKKKWKENHRTWRQLSKEEKRAKTILIGILSVFALAGLIVYYLTTK